MVKTIKQGAVDFSINYKVQTTWGFQEALTFVFEGLGATLFFLSLLRGHLGGMVTGLLILVASGILLLMHLGNPRNMIYVLANIRHSWMSRGAALIPLFIGLGFCLVVAQGLFGVSIDGNARTAVTIVMLLLAIFILLKSGLVMTTFPAITFWNGELLPIIFGISGMTTGMAAVLLFVDQFPRSFLWGFLGLTAMLLVILGAYLMTITKVSPAAKVSVDLIAERHAMMFHGIGIVIGIILPLGLGLFVIFDPSAASILLFAIMAAARLAGDIALRSVILKVGVFDKVL